MKKSQWAIGFVVFSIGVASGLGWFISVPLLRYASLTSVLRARLISCENDETTNTFDGSPRQRCYNRELVSMVRSYGIASTIRSLKSYMKTPQGTYLQGMRCHAMAHEIGNAAAQSGMPSDVLMTQCIGLCDIGEGRNPVEGIDLGCMNGAGHTWVLMSADIQDAFAKCAIPSIPDAVKEGCYHGIGHGLHERYGADIKSAVSQCLLLPNKEARYQCAHAVFMERQPTSFTRHIPFDLVLYCRELPTEVGTSCFEFIGFMQYSYTHDAYQALRICDAVLESMQSGCRNRVGEAIYTLNDDIVDVHQCADASAMYANDCVTGFTRTIIDDVNDTRGNRAIRACETLPEGLQSHCYAVIGETLLARYGEGIRRRTCGVISSPTYMDICMKAPTL